MKNAETVKILKTLAQLANNDGGVRLLNGAWLHLDQEKARTLRNPLLKKKRKRKGERERLLGP